MAPAARRNGRRRVLARRAQRRRRSDAAPSVAVCRVTCGESAGEVVRSLTPQATAALGSAGAQSPGDAVGAIVGAAWSVVLAHHSGRSDVVFGASFAGTPERHPRHRDDGRALREQPADPGARGRERRVGEWLRRAARADGRAHAIPDDAAREYSRVQRRADLVADVRQPARRPELHRRSEGRIARRREAASAPVARDRPNYPATVIVRPGEQLEIRDHRRRRALRRRVGGRRRRRSRHRSPAWRS